MVTIEVVPPAGPDAAPLLAALEPLVDLTFDAFSVATNPVAKPRMSAMALCSLLQKKTGKPATVGHMTAHDRRIVHMALKNDNKVRTQSMGDGFLRKLVIFPKRNHYRKKKAV